MSGKKKRAGYEAGFSLVALDDPRTWERVERHGEEVIENTPNLTEYESSLEQLGVAKDYFTKAELDQIVSWKHTVGKNRIANRKHLEKNTDAEVREHSRAAITLARGINMDDCLTVDGSLNASGKESIQKVIACLDKLKGVGPATASAAMVLVRPDIFCYLYDEVIDCFESQRDYKVSNYLRVNSRCLQIARKLGRDWSTSRVAKTIWIAARFLALHGEDLSKYMENPENEGKEDDDGDEVEEGDDGEAEEEEEEAESKEPEAKRTRSAK